MKPDPRGPGRQGRRRDGQASPEKTLEVVEIYNIDAERIAALQAEPEEGRGGAKAAEAGRERAGRERQRRAAEGRVVPASRKIGARAESPRSARALHFHPLHGANAEDRHQTLVGTLLQDAAEDSAPVSAVRFKQFKKYALPIIEKKDLDEAFDFIMKWQGAAQFNRFRDVVASWEVTPDDVEQEDLAIIGRQSRKQHRDEARALAAKEDFMEAISASWRTPSSSSRAIVRRRRRGRRTASSTCSSRTCTTAPT
jgi:hypothetical protein